MSEVDQDDINRPSNPITLIQRLFTVANFCDVHDCKSMGATCREAARALDVVRREKKVTSPHETTEQLVLKAIERFISNRLRVAGQYPNNAAYNHEISILQQLEACILDAPRSSVLETKAQCICARKDGQIVETHLVCPIHSPVKASANPRDEELEDPRIVGYPVNGAAHAVGLIGAEEAGRDAYLKAWDTFTEAERDEWTRRALGQ